MRTVRGPAVARLPVAAGSRAAADAVRALAAPRLAALAAIRSGRGEDVLVGLGHGASAEYGAVYRLYRGRASRMRIAGAPGRVFTWFGSVAHQNGVDCAGGEGSNRIVETQLTPADPAARRWRVLRTYYRVRGLTFRVERRRRETIPPRRASQVARALQRPPFAICGGVPPRRAPAARA